MVLKGVSAALLCAILVAWNGASRASDYPADEFLKLDLKQAVLSPKRLGPPAQFEPLPVEAKTDPAARPVQTVRVHEPAPARASTPRVAPARVAHRHGPAKHGPATTRVARKHGNPLDAQASDTRIQTWPCRSGGICEWQR